MPKVQVLHQKYAENENVVILAMNVGDSKSKMTDYWKDKGYGFRTLHGADQLAGAYNVNVFPTSVLIGPDGKVLASGIGSAYTLERDLERALEDSK